MFCLFCHVHSQISVLKHLEYCRGKGVDTRAGEKGALGNDGHFLSSEVHGFSTWLSHWLVTVLDCCMAKFFIQQIPLWYPPNKEKMKDDF